MRVDTVHDWTALHSLAGEWDDLLRASVSDTIFLTWDWLQAWKNVIGHRFELQVLVVRDDQGALVGLGPFYRARYRLLGSLPFRILRQIGDYQTGSECLDWILRRDCAEEASRAIARALAAAPGWDGLWMPQVPGWTGAAERLRRTCAEEGLSFRERPRDFAALELPATYAAYLAALSANARSTLQRRRRQVVGQEGAVFSQCRSAEELPAYLDALFDLNDRRWQKVGQRGAFAKKPLAARFYREFSRPALQRGWLRLYALKMAQVFKAVQIGYVYNGAFFQIQEGFDPDGPTGIGNVLRGQVIESLIEEGVRVYDFLGDYTDHKRRWRGVRRDGVDLLIWRPTVTNLLPYRVGVWPTGRFLRPVPPSES
jgi:CelD/BcsL family acetyltransferase involved in cellulose biosynthesis